MHAYCFLSSGFKKKKGETWTPLLSIAKHLAKITTGLHEQCYNTMSRLRYKTSSQRIRQFAIFGAIFHVLLGMSCIIIIIMYHTIFWICYLAASALNYAASILLLYGVKHKEHRVLKLWIGCNVLQIIFYIMLFCAMCHKYWNIDSGSRTSSHLLGVPENSLDPVFLRRIRMGTFLDAATSLIYAFLMCPCCSMVKRYHDEIRRDETKGNTPCKKESFTKL